MDGMLCRIDAILNSIAKILCKKSVFLFMINGIMHRINGILSKEILSPNRGDVRRTEGFYFQTEGQPHPLTLKARAGTSPVRGRKKIRSQIQKNDSLP